MMAAQVTLMLRVVREAASRPDPGRQELSEQHGALMLFAFWAFRQKTVLAMGFVLFVMKMLLR